MDAAQLRATQAPIKEKHKAEPKAAFITLKAKGSIDNEGIACKVETGRAVEKSEDRSAVSAGKSNGATVPAGTTI